jgi:hydrogenase/urease accessory protein HupE
MRFGRLMAWCLMFMAWAIPAHADELRPGYLDLTQQSATDWHMVWKAPVRGGLATLATPAVPRTCAISVLRRELVEGSIITTSTMTCSTPLTGQNIGLDGLNATFTDALVRIAPLGRPVQAARLTPAEPMTKVAARPDVADVAKVYFLLGVEHILTGYDHLLFVISLLLLIAGGWQVAKTVTAFTVAHSITLVATSLTLISVPRQPVEICIALSIIFLAVEILKVEPDEQRLSERVPWAVAFAFGLLHGFGFAGALAEIGLPEGEVPMALLTFNMGVEVGQLAIVGAGLFFLAAMRRFAATKLPLTRAVFAYGIGSIAAFWFIERLLA